MGSISVVSPISKKISTFLAALFKQLLDFRIYLFLKIFAKSINKLTRGDYVSEVQLPKLDPIPKLGEMTVAYFYDFFDVLLLSYKPSNFPRAILPYAAG